ncbi:LINE-1 retrotransposable element ORF2 protein [Linum grandiflorum]
MIDLPLSGGSFTWTNFQQQPSLSRLDRVTINSEWETHFPDCTVRVLPRVCSDHNPLMAMTSQEEGVKRPWKFESMWLEHEDFNTFLQEAWTEEIEGFGGLFLLAKRLKLVKTKLKEWNQNVFKNNEAEIGRCLCLIAGLDGQEERGEWTEERRIQRCMIKLELDKLWRRQEISWRQKSRETSLRLGDRNTSLFHKIDSHNRRRNFVSRLVVEGRSVEGHVAVSQAVVGYYGRFYTEDRRVRPFANTLVQGRIGQGEGDALVAPFSAEEVWNAVRNCASDKAPGPNGFVMDFYKKNWEVIQDRVMSGFEDFFDRMAIPTMVNCTFLCLIPKKENVEDVKDFRPISLTSSVYKIISKVLMERLRGLLPSLISRHQCAFVHGRQILDASLIANELIDSRRRSGRPRLVIKLDIEKAYDHVNWNCLLQILNRMGFSVKWCRWIHECISSPAFSVLVNGEASGFFQNSRGLRQGDSLSPFLFILVMDILSKIVGSLRETNDIEGFYMNERDRVGEVTHLLYADDTILFCDASLLQVQKVLAGLIVFQVITGLKVNLDKCRISAVGDVPEIQDLADVLSCGVDNFPGSYLGLPRGSRAVNVVLWNPVVTRVHRRLETWKARHLSFGGRLVLIKSILSNLPIYFMSIFRAPVSIIKAIEKIHNNFLWTGMADTKKFHMVSWDNVKVPKERGGLGILDLRCMNKALLGKWLWRFGVQREAWWRILVHIKFGLDRGSEWRSARPGGSAGWSVWFWICKENLEFWEFAYVDPGGGEWVRFWHDIWIPRKHLARDFPRVAAVAQAPDACISDLITMGDRLE